MIFNGISRVLSRSRFLKFSMQNFAKSVMKLPKLGDSISDATILKFHKKLGEAVKVDDIIAEVETDKVNVEIKSIGEGVLTKFFVKENEKIDVGADFIEIDTNAKPTASTDQANNESKEKEIPKQQEQIKPKEQLKPQEQVKQQESKIEQKEQPKVKQEGPKLNIPTFTGSREQRIEPMTRARKRTAERLKASQNTYAFLSTFNECDMSEATNMRNKYQEEFSKKYGVKLGFMSFFLKAAATALREMPVVNAVIDGDNIIYRDYIDISVAVATPTGLVTPVIRNCENKGFSDYELTLKELSIQARDNKIKLEDLTGGTFTISNGGVYGSMLGTPIINPPQTAILGMHNIVNRPVVRGDEIVARPIMYLALTYDHRLMDGREGVLFLKRIKELVEDPKKLVLNL